MTDIIDIAQERIERTLQDSLDARVKFSGVSRTNCVECGAPIPLPRQRAIPGVQLCVDCKAVEERRA